MAYKKNKFEDSPIMRSYEREAIKRGFSAPDKIVKKASSQYHSTGDLYKDVVLLAEGLREKGFVIEADVLEDKLALQKTAEVHLYKVFEHDGDDLLHAAHPDGDMKMFEAQNGLGDFETLTSAHDKIMTVVNKKPTGIHPEGPRSVSAPLEGPMASILGVTADILGQSLVKIAEELFEGDEKKNTNESEKFKEINLEIRNNFSEIYEKLDSASKLFKSTPININYNDIYQSYLGNGYYTPAIYNYYKTLSIKLDGIDVFFNTIKRLGGFPINSKAIYEFLLQYMDLVNPYDNLKNIFTSGDVRSPLYSGLIEGFKDAKFDPHLDITPNFEMKIDINLYKEETNKLIQNMLSRINDLFNRYLSESNISKLNQDINKNLAPFDTSLSQLLEIMSNIIYIDGTSNDKDALDKYNNIKTMYDNLKTQAYKIDKFYDRIFGDKNTHNLYNLINSASTAIGNLNNLFANSLLKINASKYGSIISNLNAAAANWNKNTTNPQARDFFNTLYSLAVLIKDSSQKNIPEEKILANVNAVLGKVMVHNIKELGELASNFLKYSNPQGQNA